ncbi:MAG: acyl-CoA/acyl-ACP dehydrogenase [Deltaproteobacteria bacterium]|nr:acyl-CoA/acyl-ACP dehydrogenase [Deltaproteobacteria bacterium]
MSRLDIFTKNKATSIEEELTRGVVRDWANDIVIPMRRQYDEDWKDHKIIEPAFKALMVDLNFQMALFPEEFGGLGSGESDNLATQSCWMFEELARADSGMAVAYGVCTWPIVMIAVKPHINKRLCAEFAPMFLNEDRPVFSALTMTEPQGGSDIENLDLLHGRTIKTTATLDGDEWVINGHKLWPSNTGGLADLMGVVCTTKPGSDDEKDMAFIFVPADTPGVTQGKPYEKTGMATDKNSDVWFENVRVPSWYRAHGPGLDAQYFREVVTLGMLSASFATGVMMNVYEILYDFCSEKTLNNKPLKEHDAIAAELAEIVAGIEASRAAVYRVAEILDRPDLYGPRWSPEIGARARLMKMFVSDRSLKDCEKAMEILAAYGADRQWDIEKHWRDLKIIQLWEGGKQLCQMEGARYFFDCKTL